MKSLSGFFHHKVFLRNVGSSVIQMESVISKGGYMPANFTYKIKFSSIKYEDVISESCQYFSPSKNFRFFYTCHEKDLRLRKFWCGRKWNGTVHPSRSGILSAWPLIWIPLYSPILVLGLPPLFWGLLKEKSTWWRGTTWSCDRTSAISMWRCCYSSFLKNLQILSD